MAKCDGFEPPLTVLETVILPLNEHLVERNEGIEPIVGWVEASSLEPFGQSRVAAL